MTDDRSDGNLDDGAITEARLAEIDARFGPALTSEQREEVRGRIARTLKLAVALRATPLTNADEPVIDFAPYRSDA